MSDAHVSGPWSGAHMDRFLLSCVLVLVTLNVANTTIGGSGLNFRSISANGAC